MVIQICNQTTPETQKLCIYNLLHFRRQRSQWHVENIASRPVGEVKRQIQICNHTTHGTQKLCIYNLLHFHRQRSQWHVENIASRPIGEVKRRWVWLVRGWVTA